MASPRQLFDSVSSGKFAPVYYFYGPEEYRLIEAQKFVVSRFLPDRQAQTNYRKLNGSKTPVSDLLTELSSLPMLGERQVFAITSFQSYKPTQRRDIYKLLTPADPNRVVILSSPPDKTPRSNSAFLKEIRDVAETVEFKKLGEKQVAAIITARLQKEGVAIEPHALNLLTHLLAGNRGAVENELDKLIAYKDGAGKIDENDIREVCSGYAIFNLFELADRIIDSDKKAILEMLTGLFAGGTPPYVLLSLLQAHFTSLYLVKNGKSPLGNRGWLINQFRRQGDQFSGAGLQEAIIKIAEADSELRQNRMKPQAVLEILAMELAEKAGGVN